MIIIPSWASLGRSSSAVHLTDCLRRFRVPLRSTSRYSQLLFIQNPSANRTPASVIHILLFLQKGATELKTLFGFSAWFLSCSSSFASSLSLISYACQQSKTNRKPRALTKEREIDFVTIHQEQSARSLCSTKAREKGTNQRRQINSNCANSSVFEAELVLRRRGQSCSLSPPLRQYVNESVAKLDGLGFTKSEEKKAGERGKENER